MHLLVNVGVAWNYAPQIRVLELKNSYGDLTKFRRATGI